MSGICDEFGNSSSGAPFPSAIVIYDKRPSKYWKVDV